MKNQNQRQNYHKENESAGSNPGDNCVKHSPGEPVGGDTIRIFQPLYFCFSIIPNLPNSVRYGGCPYETKSCDDLQRRYGDLNGLLRR